MADDEDDLWAQIYGEEPPPDEKPAVQPAPAAMPVQQKSSVFAPVSVPEARVEVVKQQEDGVKAEDATEDAAAEENDELDIQLDEDDDEFDIQLDDDSPAAGAPEAPPAAPQADSLAQPQSQQPQSQQQEQPQQQKQHVQQHLVSGPHRYVRPGLEQPSLAQARPAHALLEADEPSLIPGVAAPSAVQQLARPAGPPKRWPHTMNYNVPPQGVGDGEPMLPSEAAPGQRIRLPGQTKVTTEEYKEFLGLGHGDIFDLDPDLVADAPWRMPVEDMKAFFNYDMNLYKWREYCKRVEQYRLQYTMQRKIQTLDSSAAGPPPEIDPDLPEELRAAMAAERGHSTAPQRPMNSFPQGGPRGGPRPPFQPRQNQSSDAILLLGDDSSHQDLNGASAGQKDAPNVAARQNGGSGIRINLSPSEAGKTDEASKDTKAKENGTASAAANGASQPKPPPGAPPPPRAPSVGPPPRPSRGNPRPPPPRPPSGPFPNGPGMMPMGMHGMPYGQMGMMGMGGPMMGHPMMGNGPPMMHMGMGGPMGMGMMQGGPRMMGDFYGPMMGGPMGGPMGPGGLPVPPMMRNMYNGNMNGGGWGGGRGNSLAELGITEEEFEEYAQRKPRRDKDGDNPETETLAMGMDVDLSQAPKQAAKSRTDGHRREAGGSEDDVDRNRRRDRDGHRSRDSERPRSSRRSRSHERSRSRSRDRGHGRRHGHR